MSKDPKENKDPQIMIWFCMQFVDRALAIQHKSKQHGREVFLKAKTA
jgi:hypothetical protein